MDALLMQITPFGAGAATLIAFVLGISLAIIVQEMIKRTRAKTIAEDLQRQTDGAKREAENIIKSAQIDAATEAIKKKEQFTNEANQIRSELGRPKADSPNVRTPSTARQSRSSNRIRP